MKLTLFAVRHGNKVYEFREPIEAVLYHKDNLWIINSKTLESIDFASTKEDVLAYFANSISFLWNSYAMCEASSLNKGARELKQKLLKLITAREIV